MNFWGGLALLVGLHLAVNVWLQPRAEQSWRASSTRQKVAKAGIIAVLQTAGDFLRIAALTFLTAAAVFLLLQWAAPAATLGLLSDIQACALITRDWAKAVSGWIGQTLIWIGIAGAFFVIWALTFNNYRETLAVEYFRQLRALARDERSGALEPLPPTAEMQSLLEHDIASGAPTTIQRQQRLSHRVRHLDLVRRIDLSKQVLPLGSRGWPQRVLRLLFSEGMVDTGKSSTKRLGAIATVSTCVLLLGTAAPALRSGLIEPTVDTLAGLRIERELAVSGAQLKALASAPPVPVAADDPAYREVAEQFLDALSDSNGWAQLSARLADRVMLPADERRMFDAAFERMVARDAVVRAYAADPASGTRSFMFEDLPIDDTGRTVLSEMRRREVSPTALRAAAVERLEQAFRKAGRSVPGFRENLKKSLASFNRPARIGTFATMALSDQFALAVGSALPGPGDKAVFEAEALRAERKGLQKSFEQIVQVRFSAFLNDIVAGRPLGTALRRVQGNGLDMLMTSRQAASVAELLDSAEQRRNAFLVRGFERPAVLAAAVDRAEMRAASEALEAADWKKTMPLLAQYDDLLPGTALAIPTTLGVAAAGLNRPQGAMILRSGVPGGGGRVPKVRARGGGSLLGLVLTAASLASATGGAAEIDEEFKVPGVSVQRDPSRFGYVVKGFSWRSGADGIRFHAKEGDERLLPNGPVDPAVAKAALALAADGRPSALIVSPVKEAGVMRWMLHPVIEDTAIGADLIAHYEASGGTRQIASVGVFSFEIDSLMILDDPAAIGISRGTRDFLALVAVFRAAFQGNLDIAPQALVRLAGELEPYRLARMPTSRSSRLKLSANAFPK